MKRHSKVFFYSLVIISIGFLFYYLNSLDLVSLSIVCELNMPLLFAAIGFLLLGFLLMANSWRYAIFLHGHKVGATDAIISHGLPVFAKYIPGKVWVILGRASLLVNKSRSIKLLSYISLKEQLVYLLLGLLLSFPFVLFLYAEWYFSFLVGISIIGLFSLLAVRPLHELFTRIYFLLLKKQIYIPFISLKDIVHLAGSILLYWASWILGFYLLLKSMPYETNFIMAMGFPVSVCFGLLAVFIPAGVGVREGIIVYFLTSSGMQLEDAVTASIIARLWFIIGEIGIFFIALFFKFRRKQEQIQFS
ncbi:MAG: lysylphosphatidylglycerol synthase domain-containing protein [Salinivirgaceae bacterium]